jgi:hypothetical protein
MKFPLYLVRLLLGQVTEGCQTPFESFWKNEGKTSHFIKEMPSKFSPPITSNKLQIIVNINENKISL